jgi:hypothetical protein
VNRCLLLVFQLRNVFAAYAEWAISPFGVEKDQVRRMRWQFANLKPPGGAAVVEQHAFIL